MQPLTLRDQLRDHPELAGLIEAAEARGRVQLIISC